VRKQDRRSESQRNFGTQRAVQGAGRPAPRRAMICYSSRPTLYRTNTVIETNPIHASIDDLKSRLHSLRGYL